MSNKIIIHIIIYGKGIVKNSFEGKYKIDKNTILETMLEINNDIVNKNMTLFKKNLKLDNEKNLKCLLYAIDNEQQLRGMAKKSTGLILIFDPDEEESLMFVENIFNDFAKKNKTFDNLYITIFANKKKETEITEKAKKFADAKSIKYCDSPVKGEEKKFIEGIIKEIYNFNQNKKQEINQTEDASEGNAKKSRDCCGCLK